MLVVVDVCVCGGGGGGCWGWGEGEINHPNLKNRMANRAETEKTQSHLVLYCLQWSPNYSM